MKYLAIDTSGKNLTVVINDGKKIYAVHDENCSVRHSVELMPRVEELIKESKISLSEVDFFGVVLGAGSFTGIRIGVSTVKALCFAYNKPCLGITSFDTIAYNKKNGKVLAVIDAKHDGFYVCGYEDKRVTYEPSYVMREEVLRLSKEYKLLSFESIEGLKVEKVSVKDGLILAIDYNHEKATTDYSSVEPLYVRKSQAEEGR
jgi:tRNA threonylcarbamoyladenosine biosynthesis protein TsaB